MRVAQVEAVRMEGTHLEGLYRLHIDRAFRLAYLLTGNRAIAEDLAQDAFMKIAGRLIRLRDAGDFSAYLRKAVVNLAMSHFRRRRIEERYLRRQAGFRPEEPADTDFGARDQLRLALLQLPQRQRTAIVLRFFEDLPDAQAADVMRCRQTTVRSLVARGLHSLRLELEGDQDV